MNDLDIIIRITLAAVLSGLIGLERETHGRAAGLRTHILVCVASTLIMLVSLHVCEITKYVGTCDPSRIAAGVVTGLGFLGAGTILRSRASVKGLTTAASLWTVGAIGLAIGSGFYKAAFLSAFIVIIVLTVFSKFEQKLYAKGWVKRVSDEDIDD